MVDRRWLWGLYVLLVVCRLLWGVRLPGYIHPDEFFQGGQDLFFGCTEFIPWEFHQDNAVRSIVPPALMTWLPLKVYATLTNQNVQHLAGRETLWIPRHFLAFLSVLTIDAASFALVPDVWILLVLSTSWTSWALLIRPFTNSLESMILVLLLLAARQRTLPFDFVVGVLCGVGVFTRFTFVFFALPTGIHYLWSRRWDFRAILVAATGFLASTIIVVLADLQYYGAPWEDWASFLTPLNACLYNLKVDNLQKHGIHPHWTHALVNMFLMFGPLALLFYVDLYQSVRALLRQKSLERTDTVFAWTVVVGLGLLSMAPHQEPRFLLPLLTPLTLLLARRLKNRWFLVFWFAYNSVVLMVFGVLHQGGIVSALLADEYGQGEPEAIVFFRTYMPPSFVSRTKCQHDDKQVCHKDTCNSAPLVDLQTSDVQQMAIALKELLSCETDSTAQLIAPWTNEGGVLLSRDACYLGHDLDCQPRLSLWPHLTTEDFPTVGPTIHETLSRFQLSIFEVACTAP